MSGSRVRQALALLLIGLSLWATLHFSRVYAAQRLWLGLCATLALGLLLLSGAASFSRARRRLRTELTALALAENGGTPAEDTLAARRQRELTALKARGGRVDLATLAARSAADVAEVAGAPLGRYFVGVAVLVGLLGTFAGLMETLGSVASLLQQDQGHPMQSLLQLLTAPLAGLNVTFGASMVGILVTVTLALFAGDLSLLDEQVLAHLESHCAHRLVPALWPPEKEVGFRVLQEVSELRERLHQELSAALGTAAQRLSQALDGAERIQREAAEQAAQQQRQLSAAMTAQQEALRLQGEAFLQAHQHRTLDLLERLLERLAAAEESRAAQREQASLGRLQGFLGELAQQHGRLHEALAAADGRGAQRLHGFLDDLSQQQRHLHEALAAADERGAQRLHGFLDDLTQQQRRLHEALAAADERGAQHLHGFLNDLTQQQGQRQDALLEAEQRAAQRLQDAVRAVEGYAASLQEAERDRTAALQQAESARTAALQQAESARTAALHELAQRHHQEYEALLGQMRTLLQDGITAPVGAWQDAAREARGAAERLSAEAQTLKEAAAEFAQAGAAVGPALSALAPELSALSAELALLAERAALAPAAPEAPPAPDTAEHLR